MASTEKKVASDQDPSVASSKPRENAVQQTVDQHIQAAAGAVAKTIDIPQKELESLKRSTLGHLSNINRQWKPETIEMIARQFWHYSRQFKNRKLDIHNMNIQHIIIFALMLEHPAISLKELCKETGYPETLVGGALSHLQREIFDARWSELSLENVYSLRPKG